MWQVEKLGQHVEKLKTTDTINMKTVKEKLRYLKNTVESCRTIPRDFRGQLFFCPTIGSVHVCTCARVAHKNTFREEKQ